MRPVLLASLASLILLSQLACSSSASDPADDEAALLPKADNNDNRPTSFSAVVQHLRAKGHDLHVDRSLFHPEWPVRGDKRVVTGRAATPYQTTFAEGMVVVPTVPGDEVIAPHDGIAYLFSASDFPEPASYRADRHNTIFIWDPVSHGITMLGSMDVGSMFHERLRGSAVEVHRGDVLGKVIRWQPEKPRLRIDLFDGENAMRFNAAQVLPYHDDVAPQLHDVYILDELGDTYTSLVSGKLDILARASDRDTDSIVNLEVAAVAFSIRDDANNVLLQQPKCEFSQLVESTQGTVDAATSRLVDFESPTARDPATGSRSALPTRTFPYALTNIKVSADGRCTVPKDEARSFVQVRDAVQAITISVTLWDHNGNQSVHERTIAR